MTWISLVCLLALSSSAFGRSTYGSYQSQETFRDFPRPTPPTNSYGGYGNMNTFTPSIPVSEPAAPKWNVESGSYGSQESMASKTITPGFNFQRIKVSDELIPVQPVPRPLSPADQLCRGKRPETFITLDEGRRFVVCLDDGKGEEQACPKSLFFNIESKRCERRITQIESPCGLQGCLNGGQCLPFDATTFRCKCAPGFDGSNCELDARVCQTQQPCGQAPGTRCQSFRPGAALEYVCIHQGELAYGFSAQQVVPSPCGSIDGARPLGISDKGFVMCDGERMFVESCPGGTIWDDSAKACVWPDMVGITTITVLDQPKQSGYGSYETTTRPFVFDTPKLPSYGSYETTTRPMAFDTPKLPSYGSYETTTRPMIFDTPKSVHSYGQQEFTRPTFELPKPKPVELPRPSFDFQVQQPMPSSYGSQPLPKPVFNQPIQKEFRPLPTGSGY